MVKTYTLVELPHPTFGHDRLVPSVDLSNVESLHRGDTIHCEITSEWNLSGVS